MEQPFGDSSATPNKSKRALEGKVTLITDSPYGATTARVFHHHGAKVILVETLDDHVLCHVIDAAAAEHGGLDVICTSSAAAARAMTWRPGGGCVIMMMWHEALADMAAEFGGFGVRVNCVSPSGAHVKADDVAMAALYLAFVEDECVSGINLVVDCDFGVTNPLLLCLKASL